MGSLADQRFEVVVRDAQGRDHVLVQGIDHTDRAAWIAGRLERALGFEDAPK